MVGHRRFANINLSARIVSGVTPLFCFIGNCSEMVGHRRFANINLSARIVSGVTPLFVKIVPLVNYFVA